MRTDGQQTKKGKRRKRSKLDCFYKLLSRAQNPNKSYKQRLAEARVFAAVNGMPLEAEKIIEERVKKYTHKRPEVSISPALKWELLTIHVDRLIEAGNLREALEFAQANFMEKTYFRIKYPNLKWEILYSECNKLYNEGNLVGAVAYATKNNILHTYLYRQHPDLKPGEPPEEKKVSNGVRHKREKHASAHFVHQQMKEKDRPGRHSKKNATRVRK